MNIEDLSKIFPVGYYQLHDNAELNFQLNRYLAGGRLEDVKPAASRIRDLKDWKREMLALAEQAEKEGRLQNAAAYYREAEFFMAPGDSDKDNAYNRFVTLFEQVTKDFDYEKRDVPYEDKSLPTIVLPLDDAKDTLVMHGGFDSFKEETFIVAAVLREAGYRVILFEGPGQGAALHRQGIPMTPEWEKPTAAVLDAYGVERCSLLGTSLGGYLALRAAAFEKRIKRVIALGVMYDFLECYTHGIGPILSRLFRLGIQAEVDGIINRVATRRTRKDLFSSWAISHGMYVMGVDTPSELFRKVSLFTTRFISPKITQDVLLLVGSEDHYVPFHQFYQQARLLTSARSFTARIFTAAEHAQNHCQVGNIGLALRAITLWLNERLESD